MEGQKELEKILLSAILFDNRILEKHFLESNITSDFFYFEANKYIYANMLVLNFQSLKVDVQTLLQYGIKTNTLEKMGGVEELTSLDNFQPSDNIEFYLKEFSGRFVKRRASEILKQFLSDNAEKETLTFNEISALKDNLDVLQFLENSQKEILDAKKLSEMFFNQLDEAKTKSDGYKSSLQIFDNATNGFHAGELYILGARPSIGKTSLALSMAANMAKTMRVGFISLETPAITIAQKLYSMNTNIALKKIRNGFLSESDYIELNGKKKEVENSGFYLVDTANININQVNVYLQKLKKGFGCDVVFIDYIGLVDAGLRTMPVYERQSIVSKSLKAYARQLDMAICALCQLSRGVEGSEKIPSLADLRGSGSIEQDADVVMFLHGNRYSSFEESTIQRKLIIAKNRNGECLQGDVDFDKTTTLYKNHDRKQEAGLFEGEAQ